QKAGKRECGSHGQHHITRAPRSLGTDYFFFTLGRLGRPKWPPRSARDSRSILPTRLQTVSCRGSLDRMDAGYFSLFVARPHFNVRSLPAALDAHNAAPFGRLELIAHRFDIGGEVGTLLAE